MITCLPIPDVEGWRRHTVLGRLSLGGCLSMTFFCENRVMDEQLRLHENTAVSLCAPNSSRPIDGKKKNYLLLPSQHRRRSLLEEKVSLQAANQLLRQLRESTTNAEPCAVALAAHSLAPHASKQASKQKNFQSSSQAGCGASITKPTANSSRFKAQGSHP